MWLLSLRNAALFVNGLAIMFAQVFVMDRIEPPLLILAGVMVGLPGVMTRQRLEASKPIGPSRVDAPITLDPLDRLKQRYLTTDMDTIDFILEVDAYPQQSPDLSEVFDGGLSKRTEALSKAQHDIYCALKEKGLPIPDDLRRGVERVTC